jgi:hypothetical protein
LRSGDGRKFISGTAFKMHLFGRFIMTEYEDDYYETNESNNFDYEDEDIINSFSSSDLKNTPTQNKLLAKKKKSLEDWIKEKINPPLKR